MYYIRCFLIGDPPTIFPPGADYCYTNRERELVLTDLDLERRCPPYRAAVELPADRTEVSLDFDVGWMRYEHGPSREESWACSPCVIRFGPPIVKKNRPRTVELNENAPEPVEPSPPELPSIDPEPGEWDDIPF